MQVLVVMPGIGPEGGAEQSFVSVAPLLLERGVDLHLAVLTGYQTLVPHVERLGVVVHDLSSHRTLGSQVRALRRLVGRLRPDLVHATLWEATTPTQLALAGGRTPLLVTWAVTPVTERGSGELDTGRWKRVALELIDAALGRLSGAEYHAVTPGVAAAMGRRLRVPAGRIHVGERGRDLTAFRSTDGGPRVRRELGIGDTDRVVLAVGRQDPQKGYDDLLNAFDRLAGADDADWLLIAGREGAATPALRARREASPHRDRILLLGHRDDVAELLAAADVVVCSSWREGAAGALLEAMASGTPVVSVPLAGLHGILVDGVNARIVARERLHVGVREVLEQPEFAARLATGGRLTVEQRFTLERCADRLADIYRQVATRLRPSSAGTRPGS